MNAKTTTLLDLSSMMEETLDAITAAPDFVDSVPTGTYMLACSDCKIEHYETREKAKAQRIRMTFVIRNTIELSDANAVPVPNESMWSQTFQGTSDGVGYWKRDVAKMLDVASVDGTPFGQIMASIVGHEFKAIVTTKEKGGFTNVSIKPIAQ